MYLLPYRWGTTALALVALALPALAGPAHIHLLPGTTKEYVAAPDVRKLDDPWRQTQFAAVLQDKALQALSEQLLLQFNTNSDMYKRLGFGWDDVRAVATGEATWALIQPGPNLHAAVVLVNVAGKVEQAKARMAEAAAKRGLRGQSQPVDGLTAAVYDLNGRKVFHLIKDDVLIAVDDASVLQGIIGRWNMGKKDSLEELPAFIGVHKTFEATGKDPVHLRWFVEPGGRADVLRITNPPALDAGGMPPRDWGKIFRDNGFDAIKGAGGVVAFNVGDHDLLLRASVFAPRPDPKVPYPKALGMVSLLPLENAAVPPWVPDKMGDKSGPMSSYLTLGGDPNQTFEAFGYLFDALGQKGDFETILTSYKNEGILVDVRKEIFAQLGKRMTVLNDYRAPIDAKSERLLAAVELAPNADPSVLADALRRFLEPDKKRVRKHSEGEQVIWEILPNPKARPGGPLALPASAMTVWKGQLLMGSSLDAIQEFLKQDPKSPRLADATDFQRVQKALDDLGAAGGSVRMFWRPQSDLAVPYEMLRTNQLSDSQSATARMLNAILGLERREGEKPRFDGSKLPDFKGVQAHLGAGGGFIANKPDGWMAVGFVLKK